MDEKRTVWVESPDGKLVEEHTLANARDLMDHRDWRKVPNNKESNREKPVTQVRKEEKESKEDVPKSLSTEKREYSRKNKKK